MTHKYHSWDIVWLLVFHSVYTHVGLLAALARGGGGGRGEVCWTCDGGGCAGWCGPVSRPVMLQCPSSRRPLDNPASPCCTTSLHTHLHSYHWSGERAVMEGKWILSTGSNLKLWMMNQHKNDLIFFRPRCVVNLLMQKFKSNIFAISFVIDLFMHILESDMILKILSIEHIFIYFR